MTDTLRRITARLALSAAYEGTKVKDLTTYLKGLVPGLKIPSTPPGPGGGKHDPSMRVGAMTPQQAHELGNKLIADGWYGRKVKKNVGKRSDPEPTIREYVYYVPSSENGVEYKSLGPPYIKLHRPMKGSEMVRFTIGQFTTAALTERKFLTKLNRLANSAASRPGPSHGDRGGRRGMRG